MIFPKEIHAEHIIKDLQFLPRGARFNILNFKNTRDRDVIIADYVETNLTKLTKLAKTTEQFGKVAFALDIVNGAVNVAEAWQTDPNSLKT